MLAKANSRSTVYRANYLDYVSVKKLGPDGPAGQRVIGEYRFLGLYTHAAHTAPIAGVVASISTEEGETVAAFLARRSKLFAKTGVHDRAGKLVYILTASEGEAFLRDGVVETVGRREGAQQLAIFEPGEWILIERDRLSDDEEESVRHGDVGGDGPAWMVVRFLPAP